MRELGLDAGLLVSQAVNFGLLLALLYILLYKPVMAKLEERARRIKKGMADAERAEQLRAEAEVGYKEEMELARRDAHELIERATRAARQQREEILAQAKQEAHRIVVRAQEQARHELMGGQIALREQMVDLAVAAAARVIEREIDEKDHHRLIEEFLAAAGEMK